MPIERLVAGQHLRWRGRLRIGRRLSCLLAAASLFAAGPLAARTPAAPGGSDNFSIVESVPSGTVYGDAETLRTADVWLDMVRGAKKRIDIAAFYISDRPGSALTPVLDALRAKAAAGVPVRILVDQSFLKDNAADVENLRNAPGVVVRELPATRLTGGVLHAKYMVVDDAGVFVGSQNWDWRALSEIHEVGVRVIDPRIAQTFAAAFEFDWRLADGGDLPRAAIDAVKAPAFAPVTDADPALVTGKDHDPLVVFPAFSPPSLMPAWVSAEQPALVRFIDGTHHVLRIQVMTLSAIRNYGPKGWWPDIDTAIRDAAARGVEVRVIVADWALREPMRSYLKSLAALPGVAIRFTRVPPAAQGFIPYARVEHAKYAVFDERSAYVGTGNWEWSYFNNSVDASLFVRGTGPARTLARIFDRDWNGPYAVNLTPDSQETAPRNH